MSLFFEERSCRSTIGRSTIQILCVLFTGAILLVSADKPPYQTAPEDTVKQQIIGPSQKLGEFAGDSYYFKNAGMGTGQIFRVSNSDPTKYAAVGLIMSNKYKIQDAEKSGFFAVVTDTPASSLTGYGSSTAGPAPPPQTQLPAQSPTSNSVTVAPVAPSAKATQGEDGRTPTVQFMNDPNFKNDLVVWRKGHIEIIHDGSKFADLGYTGGGYNENGATKGLKMGLNTIDAAITNNRRHDVLNQGWEITTAKGMRNTAVVTAASASGIQQRNPLGLEGEAVTATEIYQRQIDSAFTYPGYDKLRQAAGLSSDSKQPTASK